MEKVSVATRFPFMKTPNDPESTICVPGALSSLPEPAALVAASRHTIATPAKIFKGSALFSQVRACMPPPPQLHSRPFLLSRCEMPLSCRSLDAPRTVRETALPFAAGDGFSPPAGIAATIPPPERPGKPSVHPQLQSTLHYPKVRKYPHQAPPLEPRSSVLQSARAKLGFPSDEIRTPRNHGKSGRSSCLAFSEPGHPGLRKGIRVGGSRLFPPKSCLNP